MKPQKQHSHKQSLPKYDAEAILRELFEKAKAKDEFEFCCTLLRIRGMEGPGWDTLFESRELLNQNLAFINSPIDQGYRLRLTLMTYCHATEMFDFYSVIGNMLRICSGDRYSLDCFAGVSHSSGKSAKYPQEKALRIMEWATAVSSPTVGELVLDLLVKEVRNAFFHSSYILTRESFNIRRGNGVLIGNMIDSRVLYSWLLPRLELGINTAMILIEIMDEYRRAYTNNKIVPGRIQGSTPVSVELTTEKDVGLTGFRSPPRQESKTANG